MADENNVGNDQMMEQVMSLSDPDPTSAAMTALVSRLRNKIYDNDPLKQILNNYKQEFSDSTLEGYITESWYEINEAEPQTSYSLEQFPKTALLLNGAVIQMCQSKGFLHLRNQISYNDAGFSVNLDDKSSAYAQWLGQFAQTYFAELARFKKKPPGFVGVGSPLRRWW